MEFITPEIIVGAISSLMGLVLGAGYVGGKLKAILLEVREVIEEYKKAVSADSEGGKEVTDAEKAKIAERLISIMDKAVEKYGHSLVGKLLGLSK